MTSSETFYAKMAAMPPLMHNPNHGKLDADGKPVPFDLTKSAVLKWMVDNLDPLETMGQLFFKLRDQESLVQDRATGLWRGQTPDEYQKVRGERQAARKAKQEVAAAARAAAKKKNAKPRGRSKTMPDDIMFDLVSAFISKFGRLPTTSHLRQLAETSEFMTEAGQDRTMKVATFYIRLKWAVENGLLTLRRVGPDTLIVPKDYVEKPTVPANPAGAEAENKAGEGQDSGDPGKGQETGAFPEPVACGKCGGPGHLVRLETRSGPDVAPRYSIECEAGCGNATVSTDHIEPSGALAEWNEKNAVGTVAAARIREECNKHAPEQREAGIKRGMELATGGVQVPMLPGDGETIRLMTPKELEPQTVETLKTIIAHGMGGLAPDVVVTRSTLFRPGQVGESKIIGVRQSDPPTYAGLTAEEFAVLHPAGPSGAETGVNSAQVVDSQPGAGGAEKEVV